MRPRKRNRHLPAKVYVNHGSYWLVEGGRWHRLSRVSDGETKLYEELARRKQEVSLEAVPAAVAAFKRDYLPTLSPSARKEHGRLLTVFSEEFADFRLDQVTALLIRRSIKNLYGAKPTAARHYRNRISRFLRWCVEEAGLLAANPCREVRLKHPPKAKTRWTDELFWNVRDRLSDMLQCYHDLSFLLYQRTTDVRLLEWSQVGDSAIRFAPTKTLHSSGAAVDIPITPEIRAALDRAWTLSKVRPGPGGDAPVIQTKNGMTYTRFGIHSAYKRAVEALLGKGQGGGLHPKALRPYAATVAKRQGYSIEELRVALAHSTVTTTEGYVQTHEVPVSRVTLTPPKRP